MEWHAGMTRRNGTQHMRAGDLSEWNARNVENA